jgi:hypothetical protein
LGVLCSVCATGVHVHVSEFSVKPSGLINVEGTGMASAQARLFWDRDGERRMPNGPNRLSQKIRDFP